MIQAPVGTNDQRELPVPTLKRWQPLRLGLVELFYYDNEEFHFRDGRLNFRGRNGVGKSKVLALTMPFLFDANLRPSRMEPDGDETKRMSWNILMGDYPRRIGYAWIEFGQINPNGDLVYLTLACGLHADERRDNVESWYFIVEGAGSVRMNRDIALINSQNRTLTKEALREELAGRGEIFDSATKYRAAVDDRLFRMGVKRYESLMETLIQLRQPQLSKKPDERGLSEALTQSLPPLSPDLIGEVATALDHLEKDREALEQCQAVAKAVDRFDGHYRLFVSTLARRQARILRDAQTEFTRASREHAAAQAAETEARTVEETAKAEYGQASENLVKARSRLETLQADPTNQDANRLSLAEADLTERQSAKADTESKLKVSQNRLGEAHDHVSAATKKCDEAAGQTAAACAEVLRTAESAGVAADTAAIGLIGLMCLPPADLHTLSDSLVRAAETDFGKAAKNRREDIAVLKRCHAEVSKVETSLLVCQGIRDHAAEALEHATQQSTEAQDAAETEANQYIEAWSPYLHSLQHLNVHPDELLAALAAWIDHCKGENPALRGLSRAHHDLFVVTAATKGQIRAATQEKRQEAEKLAQERAMLEAGGDTVPPFPYTRNPQARVDRAGAPLWQLIDFKADVSKRHQAGIEAALEGAGLLDAWVAPDGRFQGDDGEDLPLDSQVILRPEVRDESLAEWLKPSQHTESRVPAQTVRRILSSIRCSETDGRAETWISPLGAYRLGALAGLWEKPATAYIGYDARAKARASRIREIQAREALIEEEIAVLAQQIRDTEGTEQAANTEFTSAPPDQALREANDTATRAIQAARMAGDAFERENAKWQKADAEMQQVIQRRLECAHDLHLPVDANDLPGLEVAVNEFYDCGLRLSNAATKLIGWRRELQGLQAAFDHVGSDSEEIQRTLQRHTAALHRAQSTLEVLQGAVGMKVKELKARISAAAKAVESAEHHKELVATREKAAGEQRAVAAEKFRAAGREFANRSNDRQAAVEQFQTFASSGRLNAAISDLVLPDSTPPWQADAALALVRKIEQDLVKVPDDDKALSRVQGLVAEEFKELSSSLTTLGQEATAIPSEYGFDIRIIYQGKQEHAHTLGALLREDIETRQRLLSVRERKILEDHLQEDIAVEIQRRLRAADKYIANINADLEKRPTATGVRFRLRWEVLNEVDGAPFDFDRARKILFSKSADLWNQDDKAAIGEMLRLRIKAEDERLEAYGSNSGGGLADRLARALDYRRWHHFRVERSQNDKWMKLSGPASGGERALGITVTKIVAVATFYNQAADAYGLAPRLILMDEVFAGIDDPARRHCADLIRALDLDLIVTTEREWFCFAELPGVAICELQRAAGVPAVLVSRWVWDGKEKEPSKLRLEVSNSHGNDALGPSLQPPWSPGARRLARTSQTSIRYDAPWR
ncbi:TIGR02680 family protein [Cupriavidus basilensis]